MPSLPPPRERTVAPYPGGGRRASITLLIVREATASYDFSPHASQSMPVRFVSTMRSPSSTQSSLRDSDQFIAGFSQKGQTIPRFPFQIEGFGGRESSSLRIISMCSGPRTGGRDGFLYFRRSHQALSYFMGFHRLQGPRRRMGSV